jgi:hypothetical protein
MRILIWSEILHIILQHDFGDADHLRGDKNTHAKQLVLLQDLRTSLIPTQAI